ncbi:MAG TPA: cytochrome b/b6 domain-containing protein [Fimbriimonadaceae bacterium]|nr:cytochrome b/b6 domain-containing protein [Fimbriimonadaceae bacterium]
MPLTRVWDAPVRIFHWCFAGGFIFAYLIANVTDEDSTLFAYHTLAGYALAGLVLFRVIWLIAGTKWSRLSGLALNPKDLVTYMVGVFSKKHASHTGHNPATSWTLLAMLLCANGLAWTGWQMSNGLEIGEDIHALLANAFMALVAVHVGGVLFHSLRHCDGLVLSMIHGHKRLEHEQSIPARSGVALLMVAVITVGATLATSYEPATGTLRIPGTERILKLGSADDRGNRNAEHEEYDQD